VPQEPRQLTAATQPFPVGEPVVPQSIDYPVTGYELVNDGRIFTPFWTDPVLARPSADGAVNWPPSSYDPRLGRLFVCAVDSIGVFVGGV
jgi:quinohemoprotein ethanol dehydrogenase